MNEIEEKIQKDHVLAPYGTYQIGGPADYFLDASDVNDVVKAIDWAEEKDLQYFVFGGGSNLLFDDKGFRGLVIRFSGGDLSTEEPYIFADAGVKMSALVNAAAESGLSGIEEWNGLPGTVGGAVYGNAGCFGVEVADVLDSAVIYEPGEGIKDVGVEYFEYEYRNSKLKKEGGIVLSAVFRLETGDVHEIKEKMKEIARQRIVKQPAGMNTGSFFKNPDGEHSAGYLLDQCGMKGRRVGKAEISEQHANFFLNKGGATAAEILELGEIAQNAVMDKFGIELEREIVYVPADFGL